jgi:excisionase family DNA binding protein
MPRSGHRPNASRPSMSSDPPPERLTYSVEEAARLLGISRAFAYECIARGEIPHLRIGRRILVPRSALHKFVEGEGRDDTATG